jgi:hypothetical protein
MLRKRWLSSRCPLSTITTSLKRHDWSRWLLLCQTEWRSNRKCPESFEAWMLLERLRKMKVLVEFLVARATRKSMRNTRKFSKRNSFCRESTRKREFLVAVYWFDSISNKVPRPRIYALHGNISNKVSRPQNYALGRLTPTLGHQNIHANTPNNRGLAIQPLSPGYRK